MSQREACFLLGDDEHYLDHIAPLASIKQIPLIVTNKKICNLAEKFYPNLKIIYFDEHLAADKIVSQYQKIYTCSPKPLLEPYFFFSQALMGKQLSTTWCPHGQSDKGHNHSHLEGLVSEEELITYGPYFEKVLREKGIKAPFQRMGNYRYQYYLTHKAFYDKLLPKETKPLVLYAPTWQDQEKNSSFPHIYPLLAQLASSDVFTLKVKLHPNLYTQFPKEIELLKSQNVQLIEQFPSIYPLLAKTDLYIGDNSSIGYDFLLFQKPMIFFKDHRLAKEGTYLSLEQKQKLFSVCRKELFSKKKESKFLDQAFS